MYRRLILLIALAACLPVGADPLFESDSPLAFELTGPFRTMELQRSKTTKYPGELKLDGKTLEVSLTMRGNRRLDKSVCTYPPLKLNFSKKAIKDTVFDKEDDIKLVVQCGESRRFLNYLRTEFLIYRAFNLVTDANYKVRWVTVTYHDSEHGGARVQPAFLLEQKSRLANRLGLDTSNRPWVDVDQLDTYQAALVVLFEYMVSNPDYSILIGPHHDECCHNAKLLKAQDGRYVPVIYDFDNSGLVNARYAIPPAGLPIRRVTERLYRGHCGLNDQLGRAREALLKQQGPMLKLFADDPVLTRSTRHSTTSYLERSFEILKDPRQFDRYVVGRCRR